ncbi:MAG: hypothetical protein AAF497_09205 [Planctomycetota bacterium]
MTRRTIFALALSLLFSAMVEAASNSPEIRRDQTLRSAFLDPGQWPQETATFDVKTQLQNHFAEVIERLDANEDTSLNEAMDRLESATSPSWTDVDRHAVRQHLARKRKTMLSTLRAYAARGRFPVNRGHSQTAVPIFVDDSGTHCAVGYLMHCSGADAKVREIVEANNLVVVPDVVDGPLVDWILDSGLTQAEAAMIQPAYPPMLEATLADFAAGETLATGGGLVMSNMTAKQLPIFGDADSFPVHRILMDIDGTAYPQPDEIGAIAGVGDYYDYYWDQGTTLPLDQHTYNGRGRFSNTVASLGEMVFMEYELSAIGNQDISQVALISDPLINGHFHDAGQIIVETDILDSNGNLLETMRLDIGSMQYQTLSDIVDIPPTDSLTLRTYAAAYSDDPGSSASFNSVFHSFRVVPEPELNGLLLIVFGFAALRLRTRPRA